MVFHAVLLTVMSIGSDATASDTIVVRNATDRQLTVWIHRKDSKEYDPPIRVRGRRIRYLNDYPLGYYYISDSRSRQPCSVFGVRCVSTMVLCGFCVKTGRFVGRVELL